MAVYTENGDGTLTCVKKDLSTTDLERIIKEKQAQAGVETSPCIKDTLAFMAKTTETNGDIT